ncbi:restriction endonuclease [Rhodoblastus sphagnicola]|uniref:Restriction endonuclease n=1 Tax=Rhodoblastus sphagnicola TaxID=333368 RepID=A0A2S6N238_9HYPH|nr:DEAD/DEAH box helicase family protein [Rhodoblastus sphagnicola]MBB4199720.1 type III restriction enzyme [Rhodoblastus sphagnicola]PPQ28660.1 restriction endonuclease [Rhodoblastus sphagnicola]
MAATFFEQPILNSPYECPRLHHALDAEGQPLDAPPVTGRRRSELITPVPKWKKASGKGKQASMLFEDEQGLSTTAQEYNPTPIINEIRSLMEAWRALPNPGDWGVTPATQRLLTHWRSYKFQGVRPFFCQVEAVETIIWLTELAPRLRRCDAIRAHLKNANLASNPELFRLAMKLATGAGKTTVMAMLIAWQTVNAVRSPTSAMFSKGFLIVAPGITIRDRLRVLNPDDAESYYRTRELLPSDMIGDIAKAKIVITNFHAFKRRETLDLSKVGRSLLQGRGEAPVTTETEGQMLQRACGELLALKNVVVINDEAHHCYREKPQSEEEPDLKGDEKDEAKKNAEAARLWISGIEALKRKVGVRAVYDLSATPFFLRGSGYLEGTLFPWVVSDFSLMDAIECGIVKLPRVPVADNLPSAEMPVYRDLWKYIGKKMPKKGVGKSGTLDPLKLEPELQTALHALYGHYAKTHDVWKQAGISVPPVFIVVCNNTATSKLVYEWISGFRRTNEEGEEKAFHKGFLSLFSNYDTYGERLARPNTLLIDSEQLESGEALDPQFREMASLEIEQFKREKIAREGAGASVEALSDAELLREVMNTVGKEGRLGEGIRCVVSVSMLTEGWDANTVTHILGVRAFGTQLLCEQVVGRALRRQSYELNDVGLFNVEYADILGIPFDFAAKPVVAPPTPPKQVTRVQAVREREALEIQFPRVEGYRVDLPEERIVAQFTEDSKLVLTPEEVGPCTVLLQGIVGEGVELNAKNLELIRHSEISFHLAKHLLYTRFRDPGQPPPLHLFGQIKRVAREWIDGGYLICKGVPMATVTYLQMAEKAAERIYLACQRPQAGGARVKAILDPYNPKGSSRFVNFTTSKDTFKTDAAKCHVNYVVSDSNWEAELARVIERNPYVLSYVKNQGMQFEVPYRDGAVLRKYVPDFIVRIDSGDEQTLNLICEVKGYRGGDAQLKAETMKNLWVPGVNNLDAFGRWDFVELRDAFGFQDAFDKLIDSYVKKVAA